MADNRGDGRHEGDIVTGMFCPVIQAGKEMEMEMKRLALEEGGD